MSPRVRRAGLTFASALFVAGLCVSLALGHEKTYKLKPKPTISYTDSDRGRDGDPIDFFSGDLVYTTRTPGGKHCVADRTVRVFVTGPTVKVGETTTADDGSWKLDAEDVANGDYYASVKKKFVKVTIPPVAGVGGHIHRFRCLPRKSPTITAKP